ncbi:MAG: heparinase II/III family protein [Kiritimatiellae bacterium]|nr:heparinase II/III family protein [Kiritimatiellia bacterium]
MRNLTLFLICLAARFPADTAKPSHPAHTQASAVAEAIGQAENTHPRLFATAAEFQRVKNECRDSSATQTVLARILFDADQMLQFEPCRYEKEGRRLLQVSRTVLKRVTTLAMAFRMSGNAVYLERCRTELLAVAAFDDWNPSHFLDVAEMTLALAIGYDWLYHELDAETRATVAGAILEKGLITSKKHTGWVRASNNWGQVCHAGMLAGALALMDQHPDLAAEITHRAIVNLPLSMQSVAPKGSYPEGPGYWSYGINFNVLAIEMLTGVLKSDFGLMDLPGFQQTALYLDLVTGPSGKTFNYADGGMGRETDAATWWFAKRLQRPDLLAYFERHAILKHCQDKRPAAPKKGSQRLFPLTLLWMQPVPQDLTTSAPLNWSSGGSVPITIQRSAWDNERAVFVGLKAGAPAGPHGHMDAGSFVYDSEGLRWAYDLGAEGYHGIESRGMNLWNRKQDSDRWKIFRLNNFSHNTLVIGGQLQLASGDAKVVSFIDGPETAAVLDLTPVYTNASHVTRSGTLLPNGEYRLTDTLRGLVPGTVVRWGMVTSAKPDTTRPSTLLLRQKGKTLRLNALHSAETVWQTYEVAQPPNPWDSPNKGMVMVGFEAVAPASGQLDFKVLFTPGFLLPPPNQTGP